jgi:hypothetical protein
MAAYGLIPLFQPQTLMGIMFGNLLGDLLFWERFGKAFWDWYGMSIYGNVNGNNFGKAMGYSYFGICFGTCLGCVPLPALGPGIYGKMCGNPWDAFGKGLGYFSFY